MASPVAVARYLAAHAPTSREMLRTARTARRLVRAGRRLDAVECRRPLTVPLGLVVEACGCGE